METSYFKKYLAGEMSKGEKALFNDFLLEDDAAWELAEKLKNKIGAGPVLEDFAGEISAVEARYREGFRLRSADLLAAVKSGETPAGLSETDGRTLEFLQKMQAENRLQPIIGRTEKALEKAGTPQKQPIVLWKKLASVAAVLLLAVSAWLFRAQLMPENEGWKTMAVGPAEEGVSSVKPEALALQELAYRLHNLACYREMLTARDLSAEEKKALTADAVALFSDKNRTVTFYDSKNEISDLLDVKEYFQALAGENPERKSFKTEIFELETDENGENFVVLKIEQEISENGRFVLKSEKLRLKIERKTGPKGDILLVPGDLEIRP